MFEMGPCYAAHVARSAWLLAQMQVAMIAGALVCLLAGGAIRASGALAGMYHPGTALYFAGDVVFLAGPVVIWMLRRDGGWRRTAVLCAAMLGPVAATLGAGRVLGEDYLPWLVDGMYPLMTLGTIACVRFVPALFDRRSLAAA